MTLGYYELENECDVWGEKNTLKKWQWNVFWSCKSFEDQFPIEFDLDRAEATTSVFSDTEARVQTVYHFVKRTKK